MFMIIALVYTIAAGQVVGEPVAHFGKTSYVGFDAADKCREAITSKAITDWRQALHKEDPDSLVTMSCVPDNRV